MRFPSPFLLGVLCAGWLAGGNVIFENSFTVQPLATGVAVALDSEGNIYVGGMTTNQAEVVVSVFVNKWSPDGTQLLYSINFGGNGYTALTGIAVDSAGSAYVTGYTSSTDFPVTSGAIQSTLAAPYNAFVTKLNPAGTQMVYSTLLGGAGPKLSYAEAFGIAVDSGGNAIITGQTQGTSFPVTPNAFQSAPVSGCVQELTYVNVPTAGDAFVTKIAPDGKSLVYSTLLGGSCSTFGLAVALDPSGNAWVTGYTSSPDFPVTSGALQAHYADGGLDGYFAQFTPGGSLAYASYLGGNGSDLVTGIAFDSSGDIYLSGTSNGSNPAAFGASPTNSGGQCLEFGLGPPSLTYTGAPFVAKVALSASSVSGFTYVDGACSGNPTVAVDPSGSPWIGGSVGGGAPVPTFTTVGPVQIGGLGFLAKFSRDFTETLFSSYFDAISGLTLDSRGLAYITGAGPITATQAFVAQIDPAPPPISLDQVLSMGTVNIEGPLPLAVAPGEVVRLIGKGIGPAAETAGIVSAGFVSSSVAGVQVTFGGVPAPLLSVSATEIDCVAPFEIAAQGETTIQVQYNGVQANGVRMPVVQTAVEVLAVLNPDGTLNSGSNRAPAGSTIAVYLAGAGQTNPPSQDGQLNQAPLAQPGIPVQLQYGGANAQVSYAGAAPGLVAGILQVNIAVPAGSPGFTVQVPGSSNSFEVAIAAVAPNP
ncbi:MAG TPA: SBBP repeat-containing protein [Bryobacteraceae bacterium]|jgi:uncharacterized protein (TIGR03437 family)